MHVLLAHKTCIFDQNTGKFQVSRVGKYLFKSSTCGCSRALIAMNQAWPKSGSLILNDYIFLVHVMIAHKTDIVDQNTIWLVGRLIGWSVGQLIVWSAVWLFGRLVSWLNGWLTGCLFVCLFVLFVCLVGCLVGWLVGWLFGRQVGRQVG